MPYRRHCYYTQNKTGYYSGCGYRAAYNKYWKYCPYCRMPIMVLDRDAREEEVIQEDETDEGTIQ